MLSVGACVSQIKWVYFKKAPHSLYDLQTFDDASRGPLGAMELITRLSPKDIITDRSTGAGWAFWASVLTILALALDPFAQQILSFPLRTVPSDGRGEALVAAAQIYDTNMTTGMTTTFSKNVDMHMQGAVMNGLYVLDSPAKFTCTTANCTWPSFYSVGICSSYTNVTGRIKVNCSKPAETSNVKFCNYTLPSGFELWSQALASTGDGSVTTLNATGIPGKSGGYGNISDVLVDVGIVRYSGNIEKPEALEYRLSWCAKRFSNIEVINGTMSTPSIRSWPLESPKTFYQAGPISLNAFTVPDNATDFDGPNRTFTVNAYDHIYLGRWLATQFFETESQDTVARALYLQPNISQTIENIATSMTNQIREGRNTTAVEGIASRQETFIQVNWDWLILPGIVVLMGAMLLAASMFLSRGKTEELWKNSVLATLYMNVRGWDTARVDRWTAMGRHSKSMRGKMESNGQGGYDFVKP